MTSHWENDQPADFSEETEDEDLEVPFESSFKYKAIPLDEQMTLDESGIPFSLRELMNLRELHEELDKAD